MNTKLLIAPHNDDEVLWTGLTLLRERPRVLIVFDSYIQVARGHAGCDAFTRRRESMAALLELGAASWFPHSSRAVPITFLGFRDDLPFRSAAIQNAILPHLRDVTELWAPAYEEGGHEQHNAVALACMPFRGAGAGACPECAGGQIQRVMPDCPVCKGSGQQYMKLHQYLTYTRGYGKSRMLRIAGVTPDVRNAREVLPRSDDDIARKHRALACYRSQMDMTPGIGCWEWFMGDLREYEVAD